MSCICLYSGDFGRGVATRLLTDCSVVAAYDVRTQDVERILEHSKPKKCFVALSSPDPELCRRVEEVARQYASIIIYAMIRDRLLYIGPIVDLSEQKSCFNCFHRRCLSHEQLGSQPLALQKGLCEGGALEIPGVLPSTSDMAAYLILDMAGDLAGYTRRICKVDVHSGSITIGALVPLHACESCRSNIVRGPERLTASLLSELSALGLLD